jgi:hypothetical protein
MPTFLEQTQIDRLAREARRAAMPPEQLRADDRKENRIFTGALIGVVALIGGIASLFQPIARWHAHSAIAAHLQAIGAPAAQSVNLWAVGPDEFCATIVIVRQTPTGTRFISTSKDLVNQGHVGGRC